MQALLSFKRQVEKTKVWEQLRLAEPEGKKCEETSISTISNIDVENNDTSRGGTFETDKRRYD